MRRNSAGIENAARVALTPEEMRRLFASAESPRDGLLLRIMYRSALRRSEPGLLTLDSIDLARGSLTVRRGKHSRPTCRPLYPDEIGLVRALLLNRRETKPSDPLFLSDAGLALSGRGVYWILARAFERAAIPAHKRFPHALKHSLAIHLLDAGVPINEIQATLGHKSLSSTAAYLRAYDPERNARLAGLHAKGAIA